MRQNDHKVKFDAFYLFSNLSKGGTFSSQQIRKYPFFQQLYFPTLGRLRANSEKENFSKRL